MMFGVCVCRLAACSLHCVTSCCSAALLHKSSSDLLAPAPTTESAFSVSFWCLTPAEPTKNIINMFFFHRFVSRPNLQPIHSTQEHGTAFQRLSERRAYQLSTKVRHKELRIIFLMAGSRSRKVLLIYSLIYCLVHKTQEPLCRNNRCANSRNTFEIRDVLFEFHLKFWNITSINIPVRSLL